MDEIRDQMKEINRFSFKGIGDTSIIRATVLKDSDGFFHINEEIISDLSNPKRTGTIREDIHGKMSIEAYNAWLCNALFNACYSTAFDTTEKQWLIHD